MGFCYLDARLQMVADMVQDDCRLVDVGTDHAFLPVNLILSGRIRNAVASDIGKGPLKNAEKTVSEYGVSDKIELKLSDGLKNIEPDIYNITLAGMGGTLIVNILSAACWIKQGGIRLILQPQSHSYDVRKFLFENGFDILREEAASDGRHSYMAICAQYKGKKTIKPDEYYHIGELYKCENAAAAALIKKTYNRLQARYDGLLQSGGDKEEILRIQNALEYIKEKCEGGFYGKGL